MRRRPSTQPAELEPAEGENVVAFPTQTRMKNPAAVALGKLGGSKGGTIRGGETVAKAEK